MTPKPPARLHAADVAAITVERLARYLAWSDRAMGATASSSRFEKGSEAYWAQMESQHRGRWIGLAAALLEVTTAREVGTDGRPKSPARDAWHERHIPTSASAEAPAAEVPS